VTEKLDGTAAVRKILVVDDEESIRELCRRVLAASGYDVTTAQNGDEALTRVNDEEFDFVLTDVRMPGGCDGPSLLQAIKSRAPTTDVVVMTGFPSLETAVPTLRNGAYDYLIKPFDKELLLSVVRRCLEKRALSAELNREKTLRQELEAAYAELQKVENLKEAFMSRLSHELRTPFVPIFFMLDSIETDKDNPALQPVLRSLRSQIANLWQVVENLLLFSNLRGSDTTSYRVPVEPRALLKATIQKFKVEWEQKQLVVDLSVDDNIESIEGDPQLLATAFKHLLLNAIRFNKVGGNIRIEVKSQWDNLQISFTDTGIGIPQDKLQNIFDGFYQVAEYLTRQVGGLGLGLAIVRRIVEAHGGTITASSAPGEGCQFVVVLPIGQRGATHG